MLISGWLHFIQNILYCRQYKIYKYCRQEAPWRWVDSADALRTYLVFFGILLAGELPLLKVGLHTDHHAKHGDAWVLCMLRTRHPAVPGTDSIQGSVPKNLMRPQSRSLHSQDGYVCSR